MAERRWKIGDYTVKINPKSDSISYQTNASEVMTIDGTVSSDNRYFSGKRNFVIELFDKPTYADRSPTLPYSTPDYISVAQDRYSESIYLLSDDGAVHQYDEYGNHQNDITISFSSGNAVPASNPNSLVRTDNNLIFWYKEDGILGIANDSGTVNTTYTYTDSGIKSCSKIAWDFKTNIYMVNNGGDVYSINKNNGASGFIMTPDDNDVTYKSIEIYQRNNNNFIGLLDSKSQITYYDINTLEARGRTKINKMNVGDISYSSYGNINIFLGSGGVYKYYPNTCRLDIEIVKKLLLNGQITLYDESDFPMEIFVGNLDIRRKRNYGQDRYELSFDAGIAFENQGFGNSYINFVNGV